MKQIRWATFGYAALGAANWNMVAGKVDFGRMLPACVAFLAGSGITWLLMGGHRRALVKVRAWTGRWLTAMGRALAAPWVRMAEAGLRLAGESGQEEAAQAQVQTRPRAGHATPAAVPVALLELRDRQRASAGADSVAASGD